MGVSFGSFEIPKSGLMVNERALYVTGHNISNVNTPGYVRQQAMITTGPYVQEPGKYGTYSFGLGADIQQIRQIRHTFLDNIYRQESTTLGYWESRNKTFQDVQAVLGEPMGAGLQNVMNQFWDSWQELSKDPGSLTVRSLVRQRGESLIQQINHVGEQLDKLQSDLNSEIKVRVDEVNQLTNSISKLNVQIMTNEVSGDTANDLRDQRNMAVDRLTKLLNVEVNEMNDGQLDITLGGYFLVSKGIQTKLYAGESSEGGLFVTPMLEGTKTPVPIRSGIIKGLMESRGEVLGSKGSYSNGTPNTKADINFVVDISDTSAANIAKIKTSISKYVNEMNRPGVDFNLNLLTFDGTGTNLVGSYGNDTMAFLNDLNTNVNAGTNPNNDFNSVVNALTTGVTYRDGANRYALVFTGESIDGNNGVAVTDPSPYVQALKGANIKTSVITSNSYFTTGETGLNEEGWDSITSATGGKLYDINSTNFDALMTDVAMDNVNDGISNVTGTANIIPDLRKQLNALVNIMARELNKTTSSGRTLDKKPGTDFFVAINSDYPLEMGNIKLNDNLLNLNNIVSAATDNVGDNKIALQIANMRNQDYMTNLSGRLSLDEYYQSVILSVGNGGLDASSIASNQQKLVNSADANRQAITGVSMDEEMTNMMKYKYAYDAASKLINAIDTMLDTVISKMGTVGR